MIYKVLYQEDNHEVPNRETTKTLYVEADSKVALREILESRTPYMIEHIEELSPAHEAYERKQAYFTITEFDV